MPNYAKPLGDAIRKARVKLGFTQRGLAEQLHIDERTVLNIENYHGNPEMRILYPLVRTLEVDPWDIFYSELEQESKAFRQLRILLKECSDDEIAALLPVIQATLAIVKAKSGAVIEKN